MDQSNGGDGGGDNEPVIDRLPLGIMRHDLSEIPLEVAMQLYDRDQILWIRLDDGGRRKCAAFDPAELRHHFNTDPSFFSSHWNVENSGAGRTERELSAMHVLGGAPRRGVQCLRRFRSLLISTVCSDARAAGKELPAGAWYCSSILQNNDDALARFYDKAPFATPELLEEVEAAHDDGVWLFVGSNPAEGEGGVGNSSKKRRRTAPGAAKAAAVERSNGRAAEPAPTALRGRPEHTDSVDHDGTWHVQLQGRKTWFVRPLGE